MASKLGRHNTTLYLDELERVIGGMRTVLAKKKAVDLEYCYYLGAINALGLLMKPDIPSDYASFVGQLKMHFEEGE